MICVNSVTTYPANVTIKKGNWFYGASVQVCPENATCTNVTWSSSNESVATVNASCGYIYAKSAGSARIYATATDGSGEYDYICVTVTDDVLVTSVTVTPSYKVMTVGDSAFLHETVCPENATNKAVFWCSSNENIATVNPTSGLVTAKGVGTATIYATAQDGSGEQDCCDIRVNPILVCCVNIDQPNLIIHNGTTHDMTATVFPANATNKAVKWYSSNTSVANIGLNSGILRAKGLGTTFISAVSQDGTNITDCRTITVIRPIDVESVTVSPDKKTLDIGEKITLTATVSPEDATFKDVVWTSSDTNIATVDEETGEVTGISDGVAIITANSINDCCIKGSCTVTVDSRERVIIEKDGDFNKVTFLSTGKTWYCINRDMLFSDIPQSEKSILYHRRDLNYFVYDREWDNTQIRTYSDDELLLLYAIDPHGVALYVSDYASHIGDTDEEILDYKDHIFELIYGRKPHYYARNVLGQWYRLPENNTIDILKKVSESELLFGLHNIYDLTTLIEFITVILEIAVMFFEINTPFFSTNTGIKIAKTAIKTLLFGEALVKNELSVSPEGYIENLYNGVDLSWLNNFVSICDNFSDLFGCIASQPNFYKEFLNYFENKENYNISIKLRNGTIYEIKDINQAMAELQ